MSRRSFLLLLCAAAAAAKTPRPAVSVPIRGSDGKPIELRKFRGRTVLLMIFSTQCDDCIRMLDIVNRIQKDLGPKGLQVIGAAGDPNAKYMLPIFVQRYRPAFPIGFIEKEAIIKVADVPEGMRPVVPILLFIDRWGMVREQYYGDHPVVKNGEPAIRALANAMLGVTPVGTQQAASK
jgi:peroxiredoxin